MTSMKIVHIYMKKKHESLLLYPKWSKLDRKSVFPNSNKANIKPTSINQQKFISSKNIISFSYL